MAACFNMDGRTRGLLRERHREAQVAIQARANDVLGLPSPSRLGIGKAQGGVRVGNLEICVRWDSIVDDWAAGTAEELAVVLAIQELGEKVAADDPTIPMRLGLTPAGPATLVHAFAHPQGP